MRGGCGRGEGSRERGDTRETRGGPEKLNGDDQEGAAPPDMDMPLVTMPATMPTSALRCFAQNLDLM